MSGAALVNTELLPIGPGRFDLALSVPLFAAVLIPRMPRRHDQLAIPAPARLDGFADDRARRTIDLV
jgi:hypothetical protein